MSEIPFTACITAGSQPELKALAAFDDYFSFSGRKYTVIKSLESQNYEVKRHKEKVNIPLCILKVLSYLTGIIPLIMALGKLISRSIYTFNTSGYLHSEKKLYKGYFNAAKTWALLDGVLSIYEEKLYDKAFLNSLTSQSVSLYKSELKLIERDISPLKNVPRKVVEPLLLQKLKLGLDIESKELIALADTTNSLQERYSKLLLHFKTHFNLAEEEESREIIGISNPNTLCYMISALQPLLAIHNFSNLVPVAIEKYPHEGEIEFQGRQRILACLNTFMSAWKEHKSPSSLGRDLANLRTSIFDVGLLQGGFLDKRSERRFQDAGSFFELLLYVIGQGFQQKLTRKPVSLDPRLQNYSKVEQDLQGVFHLKAEGKYTGSAYVLAENQSVPNLINKNSQEVEDTLSIGNEWRIEIESPAKSVEVSKYSARTMLVGNPPGLLVMRVDGLIVNPTTDTRVDFSHLFENNVPSEEATYELTGFAQNHNQVHWTSIVNRDGNWFYCNDDRIAETTPQSKEFKKLAHYLVYRKIT